MNRVIISMTSYPARIDDLGIVLDSLCRQTYPADKIVLYLSELQFKDKKIEYEFDKYRRFGFEIHWCKEDIGSHKKYYYALQEYSDDIVITVDDDWNYSENLIRELMIYYKRYPTAILARRAHLIVKDNKGNVAPYIEWWKLCKKYVGIPKMDLFATTGGGTLFPPHVFPKICLDIDAIMGVCPYADDIWIKIAQLIGNIPTVLVKEFFEDPPIMKYADNGLFQKFNNLGGNDKQWQNTVNFWESRGINSQTLIDRLFRDGATKSEDVNREILNEYERVIQQYMKDILLFKKVNIYGAGIVAKRVYSVLKQRNLHEKINSFVVEDKSKNAEKLFALPVVEIGQNYNEMHDGEAYIIALAIEKEQKNVQKRLIELGVSNDKIYMIDPGVLAAFKELENLEGV